MPKVTLERKGKLDGHETFFMKTASTSKEFSATLRKFLGAGWENRPLKQDEMLSVAKLGMIENSEVNFAAFKNAKVPKVEIHTYHLKHKQANALAKVEIQFVDMKE